METALKGLEKAIRLGRLNNEKQILEMVLNRGFAMFEDGIYYLHGRSGSEIWFHEFATGRGHMVSAIEGRLA
jgi:hypothetical protein